MPGPSLLSQPRTLATRLAALSARPAALGCRITITLRCCVNLQALGMGMDPAGAVATSAAIKWITKDGLGAAGRLIVGGRLASGGSPWLPGGCQARQRALPASHQYLHGRIGLSAGRVATLPHCSARGGPQLAALLAHAQGAPWWA